jgi:hypothetical protein
MKTLAMPPVHSLTPKLSSNRAATANASRCIRPSQAHPQVGSSAVAQATWRAR